MGSTVNMTDASGETHAVALEAVPDAVAAGWRTETGADEAQRVASDVNQQRYGGVAGTIDALGQGAWRGLTLGGSDVAARILGGEDTAKYVSGVREANPGAALVGTLAGSLAPAFATGGASEAGVGAQILGYTPAGLVGRAGNAIRAGAEGAGLAERIVAGVGAGAVEGAAFGGGDYISQVALGDKPLSAEAFVGAMGHGALFGGAVGGGLTLTEGALLRAKSLFPQRAVTREAAEGVEREAQSTIRQSLDDGAAMQQTAKQKLDELRIETAKHQLDANKALADVKLAEAQARLERQQALLERAKAGSRRPRKVFEEPATPAAGEPVIPSTAADVTDGAESVVSAQALKERGWNELPGTGEDLVKMDKARKAIAEGQRDPVTILVSPKGVLDVQDGRHRLAAALEAGKPVKVRWSRGTAALDQPRAPTLLDQLSATKSALDEGQSLGALSRQGAPVAAEDAANEAIAASSPDAAKLVDAAKRERMSREEIQAWVKGRRAAGEQNAAQRGYKVSYESSLTGAKGPAGLPMKMDRVTTFGEETPAFLATQAKTLAKLKPAERLAADTAVESMFGGAGKTIGEQILEGTSGKSTIDDAISNALRKHVGEHVDLTEDIAKAAKAIGDHEQASADLAEALGEAAPAGAQERAAQYRQATSAKAESDAAGAAGNADAIANKLAPEVARSTGKAVGGDMLSKLGDAGAAIELLNAMGIHTADLSKIPVIGPVLSLYLKARAVMGVLRRAGGSVPRTAESTIASKAAATRNRVNAAVTKMLDVGAAGARAGAKAGGAAALLGAQLFPSPGEKPSKEPSDGDAVAAYRRRMDELARASQPGAVLEAVRDRVHTSDPQLQQEIAAAVERKLQFLNSKAPRETMLPTLLRSDGDWRPSKVQLEEWGRYVQAAEDPASVLEDVASGKGVSIEAAETLRKVYPSVYREAQTILLERAQVMEEKLPYSRRVALSILFNVPVDGTMSPQHIAFLQQGTTAAQPMPAQGSPAGAPPTPSMSGPMALGDRVMTSLDRRSGT